MKTKLKLKFILEYMSNPLSPIDEMPLQNYGFHITNLQELGLSNETISLSEFVVSLFWERLNPIYQGLPSFWSGKMCLFYQSKLVELYNKIIEEIGDAYEIENGEVDEMEKNIDVDKIDSDLIKFVSDPVSYYKAKNISFSNSNLKEKNIVISEFNKWQERERILLLEK